MKLINNLKLLHENYHFIRLSNAFLFCIFLQISYNFSLTSHEFFMKVNPDVSSSS